MKDKNKTFFERKLNNCIFDPYAKISMQHHLGSVFSKYQ